jgi:N-methylhydantoinase B/oxoprolinase/acetone carboxylase alpha subunit
MINLEATHILLNYKKQLEQEILDLRAQACQKAAIKRAIEKAVSEDDEQELLNFLSLQEAYSLKGISDLIFKK